MVCASLMEASTCCAASDVFQSGIGLVCLTTRCPGFASSSALARRAVKEGGLRGLWKGNVSCLARELPGNAAWFGAYDTIIKSRPPLLPRAVYVRSVVLLAGDAHAVLLPFDSERVVSCRRAKSAIVLCFL